MAQHRGESFVDGLIVVDGNEYLGCTFRGCTLAYNGGVLPVIKQCRMEECRWEFGDAAQRTLSFMICLYHGMGPAGRELIEETFAQVRTGAPEAPSSESSAPEAPAARSGVRAALRGVVGSGAGR